MKYYAILTKEVLTIDEIRARNKQMSIPDNANLEHIGIIQLAETAVPAHDAITQGVLSRVEVDNKRIVWDVYPLPPEQVQLNTEKRNKELREQAKAARQAAVDAIKVTTSSGKVFDGDEQSQNRMTRAVIGLQAAAQVLGSNAPSTISWTLADNTVAEVTAAELGEALVLAGQEQSRLWTLNV